MQDSNSELQNASECPAASGAPKPHSSSNAVLIGFVSGAAVPVCVGVCFWGYGFYLQSVHLASLPKAANVASCGMWAMGPFLMVFVVGPICGAVGSFVALAKSVYERSL